MQSDVPGRYFVPGIVVVRIDVFSAIVSDVIFREKDEDWLSVNSGMGVKVCLKSLPS